MGTSLAQLALYILYFYKATEQSEKDEIQKDINNWTVNFVFGLTLGIIGGSSSFDGTIRKEVSNEISQKTMKVITKIIETALSYLDLFYGGQK